MNIPINNYRKYIAGKLFAVCGILLALILCGLIIYRWIIPFDKDIIDIDYACLDFFKIMFTLFVPPIFISLSILEFFIRKHFHFPIKVKPFKELNKLDKFLTTIFWTSIILILIQFFMILRIIIIEHFLY